MIDEYYVIYTVDDEEVNCNRCDKACDDKWCNDVCGAKHGWHGYERSVPRKNELRKKLESYG